MQCAHREGEYEQGLEEMGHSRQKGTLLSKLTLNTKQRKCNTEFRGWTGTRGLLIHCRELSRTRGPAEVDKTHVVNESVSGGAEK